MKSKLFVICSIFVLASLVLSACGATAGGEAGGPLQSVGEGEGEVAIISWAGYIERGETDPNYDWVTEFEKNTSCKVTNKTAATSDEMVALMNEGGFDLVTASGDASNRSRSAKELDGRTRGTARGIHRSANDDQTILARCFGR